MRRRRVLVFGGVFNIIFVCLTLIFVGMLLIALFAEELSEKQRADLTVIGAVFTGVSFILLIINILFAVVLDEEKVVVKRPFFKDYTMLWAEVAEVEAVRFSFLRFIYISDFSAAGGPKLIMNSFRKNNKLIFLWFSRKKLQIIRRYYKGEIKEFSCRG